MSRCRFTRISYPDREPKRAREATKNCPIVAALKACAPRTQMPFNGPDEDYRDRYEKLTGHSLRQCPVCHRGRMITFQLLPKFVLPRPSQIIMVDPMRLQIVISTNSMPSSRRNRVVLRAFPPSSDQPSTSHLALLVMAEAHEHSPPSRSHPLPTVCYPNLKLPLAIQNP
jgi:hypothetical protein